MHLLESSAEWGRGELKSLHKRISSQIIMERQFGDDPSKCGFTKDMHDVFNEIAYGRRGTTKEELYSLLLPLKNFCEFRIGECKSEKQIWITEAETIQKKVFDLSQCKNLKLEKCRGYIGDQVERFSKNIRIYTEAVRSVEFILSDPMLR